MLHVDNKEWDDYFTKEKGIAREERYSFCYEKAADIFNEQIRLPDGFSLKEIDKNLLARITGKIVPSFSWNTETEFLKKGKGFCALFGTEIAAVAFTSAVSHDEIDIGIETNEAFRRRGLAVIAAGRMVQYILEQHKTPVWECHTGNIGSRHTAEKIGFHVQKTHPFFKAGT